MRSSEEMKESLLGKESKWSYLEPGSVRSSILTLCANSMGAGLLSIPYVFSKTGLIGGIVMLLLGAVIFAFYYRVLIKAHDQTQVYNYSGTVKKLLGEGGRRTIELCFIGFSFGVLCVYQVLAAGFILDVLQAGGFIQYIGLSYETARITLLLVVSLLVLTPLTIPEKMTALRYASSICLIALFYIIVVLIVQLPSYLVASEVEISYIKTDLSLINSFTICVFAFDGILGLSIIYGELSNKSYQKMTKVIDRAVGLSVLLYIVMGTAGYLALGTNTPNLITEREYLWGTDWYMIVAELLIGFTLIAAVPLKMTPLRNNVEQLVSGTESERNYVLYYGVTYVSLYASTFIAVVVPNAIKYFSFLGGFLIVPIAFVIPGILYFKLENSKAKLVSAGFLSVVLGLMGIYSTISTIIT